MWRTNWRRAVIYTTFEAAQKTAKRYKGVRIIRLDVQMDQVRARTEEDD